MSACVEGLDVRPIRHGSATSRHGIASAGRRARSSRGRSQGHGPRRRPSSPQAGRDAQPPPWPSASASILPTSGESRPITSQAQGLPGPGASTGGQLSRGPVAPIRAPASCSRATTPCVPGQALLRKRTRRAHDKGHYQSDDRQCQMPWPYTRLLLRVSRAGQRDPKPVSIVRNVRATISRSSQGEKFLI